MNAVFLPVFAQHLWSAVVFAGLTAAGIQVARKTGTDDAETKRATIRVKPRPANRTRRFRR
jgi:hypothetical protein